MSANNPFEDSNPFAVFAFDQLQRMRLLQIKFLSNSGSVDTKCHTKHAEDPDFSRQLQPLCPVEHKGKAWCPLRLADHSIQWSQWYIYIFEAPPPAIIPTSTTIQMQPSAMSSQPVSDNRPSTSTQPPAYTASPAQNVNMDSIQKQQEELAKKAAELDRKEQALRNSQAAASGGKNPLLTNRIRVLLIDITKSIWLNKKKVQIKNFPPLPQWCPFGLKPCFYQDINIEIPVDFQKWVRMLFYLWLCKSSNQLATKTTKHIYSEGIFFFNSPWLHIVLQHYRNSRCLDYDRQRRVVWLVVALLFPFHAVFVRLLV